MTIGANFEIRITPTGTKQVIYDSAPKVFAEHSGTTILAYSKGSGTLVNVALLNSDGAGGGVILDNLVAQYKVINAVAGAVAPEHFHRRQSAALQHSVSPAYRITSRRPLAPAQSRCRHKRRPARRC